MRVTTTILATVAFGAILALGTATASMAGGGHDGGRGGMSDAGRTSMSRGSRAGISDHEVTGRSLGRDGDGIGTSRGDIGHAFGARSDHDHDITWDCKSMYPSYDPASGTYLGKDGLRHYC